MKRKATEVHNTMRMYTYWSTGHILRVVVVSLAYYVVNEHTYSSFAQSSRVCKLLPEDKQRVAHDTAFEVKLHTFALCALFWRSQMVNVIPGMQTPGKI